MTWHFENDRPIYTQLLEQIRLRIISGIYAAGSRLPSVCLLYTSDVYKRQPPTYPVHATPNPSIKLE